MQNCKHYIEYIEVIIIIIIIIFYFENFMAFFHAKLGLDVCPSVDYYQIFGETIEDSTRLLVENSSSASYPPIGNLSEFLVVGCPSTPTSLD